MTFPEACAAILGPEWRPLPPEVPGTFAAESQDEERQLEHHPEAPPSRRWLYGLKAAGGGWRGTMMEPSAEAILRRVGEMEVSDD